MDCRSPFGRFVDLHVLLQELPHRASALQGISGNRKPEHASYGSGLGQLAVGRQPKFGADRSLKRVGKLDTQLVRKREQRSAGLSAIKLPSQDLAGMCIELDGEPPCSILQDQPHHMLTSYSIYM